MLGALRKADSAAGKSGPEFEGVFRTWSTPCVPSRSKPKSSTGATRAVTERGQCSSDELAGLNHALAQVERAFLLDKGLADRPWFRHAVYAPGLTTGYAAWPLPAIRQPLEEDNKPRLAADLPTTVERIKSRATAALEPVVQTDAGHSRETDIRLSCFSIRVGQFPNQCGNDP